jgi:hypothetical protein
MNIETAGITVDYIPRPLSGPAGSSHFALAFSPAQVAPAVLVKAKAPIFMEIVKQFAHVSARKDSIMTKTVVLSLVIAVAGWAQTKLDVATQSKHVDYSNATSTKPVKVGAALPSTCSTGEAFFNSNAPVGFNLYICATTNLWLALGNGGSGGAATSIMPATLSSFPSSCSVGDVRFALDAALGGGGYYLYSCTAVNTWTQFGYVAGASGALASSCSSVPCTIDITAAVPLKALANIWTGANDFSGASKTAPFRVLTTDPASCDPTSREWVFNTTTNTLKSCNSTNTWTAVNSGGDGLKSVYYPVGLYNSGGSSLPVNWGVDLAGPVLNCNSTSPSPCDLAFLSAGLPKAAYLILVAPSTFTTLTVTVEWFSNSTVAGNLSMQVDAQCLSKDSTAVVGITPAWTGPQSAVVANNTSTQSVRRQTVFTMVGTCSAGDMMRVRFQRLATGDTYADTFRFMGASVTY